MKKIMIVLFILFVFSIKSVYAQDQYKLTLLKQDNIYYYRVGENVNESLNYYLYKFGDMYAYCLEPGINITTYNYIGIDNYIDLPFSDALKEKLELIGYYGREYPGHDNLKYSMAAQALIWEEISNTKVSFWTKAYGKGEEINVGKERNEIMNLVNRHQLLPNISNLDGFVKKEIIVEDSNNVLENYEITDKNIDAYIDGNTLQVFPSNPGQYSVNLKRKDFNEYQTIIFIGSDKTSTQKFGRLHYEKEVETTITVNVLGSRLLIHKVDENNNPILKDNISFKIKNLQTGEYLCQDNCYFLTNSEGVILTDYLDFGEYEIEEEENQIIDGYTWNKNKVMISINSDSFIKWNNEKGNYIDVFFPNQKVRGNIEINKVGEKFEIVNDEMVYQEIPLENMQFSLYDEYDNYIDTLTTNRDGIGTYNNLALGKYYLIEDTKIDKYIDNNEKYFFEIKQDNQYDEIINVKLKINNYLKKGNLEFTKEDLVTGVGIPNTIIEIYDEKDNLWFTKETDELGKVIINNLPMGKYYIIEKKANENYLISDKKVFFEIKENNEIVKAKMINKKITGTLEITKYGEEYNISNNEITYENNKLSGIEFSVYDINNNFINSIKTDENGHAKIDNLNLGNYYLIENNINNNYINDDSKYFFEIKKERDSANIFVHLDINNYLKKGNLEFTKEDLVTSEGIANTIIEIYDENDNLLFIKETDELGKVIINNLPIGKYYILEKEANSNYLLTNEKVFFEIKENNEIVKAYMTNEKINVPVPKTGKSNWQLLEALFSISFLFSIGVNYAKNKIN